MDIIRRLLGRTSGQRSLSVPPQFLADFLLAGDAGKLYRRTGSRDALDSAISAWERTLSHPALYYRLDDPVDQA